MRSIGEVIESAPEPGAAMWVRIGIERWTARLGTRAGQVLPSGTLVKVTTMHSTVFDLEVREAD